MYSLKNDICRAAYKSSTGVIKLNYINQQDIDILCKQKQNNDHFVVLVIFYNFF